MLKRWSHILLRMLLLLPLAIGVSQSALGNIPDETTATNSVSIEPSIKVHNPLQNSSSVYSLFGNEISDSSIYSALMPGSPDHCENMSNAPQCHGCSICAVAVTSSTGCTVTTASNGFRYNTQLVDTTIEPERKPPRI